MPRIVQEKFQVIAPDTERAPAGWVTPESVRQTNGTTGGKVKNALPPGANIANQNLTEQHPMPHSMAGETDVSHDANAGALLKGYTKRELKPTDDEYSRQHNDAFYDDVGGFVERNNMLDRL